MLVAIAQLNSIVGDVAGNGARIVDAVERARRAGADLVVTPELSLCGYPPEDILFSPAVAGECKRELAALVERIAGPATIVGFPEMHLGKRYNAIAVVKNGAIVASYRKATLASSPVLDEARYFETGTGVCVFEVAGIRVGAVIGDDLAVSSPALQARAAGAQVIVAVSASPYHLRRHAERRDTLALRCRETGVPIVFVNSVGGQRDVVFDGASFVADAAGSVVQQAPAWHKALVLAPFEHVTPRRIRGELSTRLEAHVYAALCTGVRDHVEKSGAAGVAVALSGDIGSALTLAVATDALGPARVRAIAMPSSRTDAAMLDDARTMAGTLGVRYDEIATDDIVQSFAGTFVHELGPAEASAGTAGIAAHVRATVLDALAKASGAVVLATACSAETLTDEAAAATIVTEAFAVLMDVSESLACRLARERNALGRAIPERIVSSAGLTPPCGTADDALPDVAADGKMPAPARRRARSGIRIAPRAHGVGAHNPPTFGWNEARAPHAPIAGSHKLATSAEMS